MKDIETRLLLESNLTYLRRGRDLLPVNPFDDSLPFSGMQVTIGKEIQTGDREEHDRQPVFRLNKRNDQSCCA